MKKNLFKGIIIGVLLSLVVSICFPTMANVLNNDVIFNVFRLKSDTNTIFSWGEYWTLDNNRTVPSSIACDGEDYLSMRIVKQMLGDNLLWNGDSSTYTLLSNSMMIPSTRIDSKSEKDIFGNTWVYEVRSGNFNGNIITYIYVSDEERGFSRAYELAGEKAFEFFHNSVYFVKYTTEESMALPGGISKGMILTRIMYANNPDNQDGDEIYTHFTSFRGGFSEPIIIDGIMYYFSYSNSPNGFHTYYTLVAVDCQNPEYESCLLQFESDGGLITIERIQDEFVFFQREQSYDENILINNPIYYKAKLDGIGEIIEINYEEYIRIFNEVSE